VTSSEAVGAPRRLAVQSVKAWRAADVSDPLPWTFHLTAHQRNAIVTAAATAFDSGMTVATVRRGNFDLPNLRSLVGSWIEALREGRGFVLIKGFPIDLLTPEQTELAYVGLGLQLGEPVGQDADGNMLGHVRDEGVPRSDPTVRLYKTKARQDFHTDGSDIVGLLCLAQSRIGGESRIASSLAVYNELLATRPDLLEVLYEPMYWDRNGEESPGEDPYFALPVIHDTDGIPRMFFIGWYIRDAQRHAEVPRLAARQLEALDAIERLSNDPEFHVEMTFEPGDIQLLSNAWILHAREAYEEDAELDSPRHLLRLWLMAHDFAGADDLLRGGIPVQQ
jgi:hypothetical protein